MRDKSFLALGRVHSAGLHKEQSTNQGMQRNIIGSYIGRDFDKRASKEPDPRHLTPLIRFWVGYGRNLEEQLVWKIGDVARSC